VPDNATAGSWFDPSARRAIRLIDATAGETAAHDGATGADATDDGPLLDAALGAALLQQVAAGATETLRIYRPQPTLAFSGRDCASPGIAAAAAAARAAGFVPVRRGPGGRAAAYHRGTLCLDHVGPVALAGAGAGAGAGQDTSQIRPRFAAFAELIAGALRSAGIDAGIGPVPGEYCPGEFSIHDGAGHKLVGTAQRLVRGGWLFGTVLVVQDPEPLRSVLDAVYGALGLEWDPRSVGAVSDATPGGVGIDEVLAALLDAYRRLADLVPATMPDDTVALARTRLDLHRVR
jgi:lipoate-protein ligase A